MKPITPARFKLEDVPPVGFWGNPQKLDKRTRCPEDIPIPSVFRAVMEYLGEGLGCQSAGLAGCTGEGPLACAYAHLLGVSGAAWYSQWHEGWSSDHLALVYMAKDFETPERRIFQALGYPYKWYEPADRSGPADRSDPVDNQSLWMELIYDSLYNRRKPVISYGIVGPPEPSIITGWDEGGEVLMGWSFFQNYPWKPGADPADFEPDGQFRKRSWMDGNLCILVIGEKTTPPDIRETDRSSLEWALEVIRKPVVWAFDESPDWWGLRWNGIAAIDAWKAAVLDDANWVSVDEQTLNDRYWRHNDKAFTMAEGLCEGDVYLQQVAARHPRAAAELLRAGRMFADCHDMAFRMHHILADENGKDDLAKLRDSGVRQRIAEVIEVHKTSYEQGGCLIEEALKKL